MRTALLALAFALAGIGCGTAEPPHEGFKLLHVTDLVALREHGGVTVLDANRDEFRQEHGVIPGTVLLSKYNAYDVANELPADKKTPRVYYCADSH
jgi:hypothetical protein